MRIHTNLTEVQLHMGIPRGVGLTFTHHGSRKRPHAFEVTLTGYGARHTRRKNAGGGYYMPNEYAATWSDWGRWLASLYERDPAMIVGSPGRPIYASADDFHAKTFYLFDTMGTDDNEPKRLADEVRHELTTGATKTAAIAAVATQHRLPFWIVKSAIYGE